MSADSFRDYLTLLDMEGDLTRIRDEVSWNLEASAVTMMANLVDDRVPVFERVAGENASGARLVGDPYRGPRNEPWKYLARAFDLPSGLSGDEYYEAIIDRLQSPVSPETVPAADAPCKEVIHVDDADLLSVPWPYIHAGDGGRYANLHTLAATDPDSEWTDWSYHRMMIHDSTKASLLLFAGEQTPNLYYYKYEQRNDPMPVAVAIGADPAVECTSAMWIPTGRDEAEFAGGLKRAPVELVECETNDLLVPASAELVIEGHVAPDERLDEGPYGEYFGYIHGPRRSMPVVHVDAITHRERPYVPFCVEGSGVGYSLNSSTTMELACVGPDATLGLRAAGFDVEKCVPWSFTPRTAYTVATDKPRPGYLHELANFIYTTWGMLHVDFFVFVDSEVDPLDQRAVLEAIALHADPTEDFHQFGAELMPKVPLNIYQTPEEKGDADTGTSKTKTAKSYIDATRRDDDDPEATKPDETTRKRAQETLRRAGMDPATLELLGSRRNGTDSENGAPDGGDTA